MVAGSDFRGQAESCKIVQSPSFVLSSFYYDTLVFYMFEQFKTRAEAVSAEVHRFATREAAREFIVAQLRTAGPSVWADCDFDRDRIVGEAPGVTFKVTREAAANASVGVSGMDWGIAETGTLLQDASSAATRLVSTLPMEHIALLSTARIVKDLPTALSKIDPRRARYIAAITGPSRTADIERVLTIGVHGPERLIIVCIDEEAAR